jgi:hypothetical protein
MRGSKKTRVLTHHELAGRADSSFEAREALKRYEEMKGEGGSPICYHSETGGYRVVDDLEVKPRPQT